MTRSNDLGCRSSGSDELGLPRRIPGITPALRTLSVAALASPPGERAGGMEAGKCLASTPCGNEGRGNG